MTRFVEPHSLSVKTVDPRKQVVPFLVGMAFTLILFAIWAPERGKNEALIAACEAELPRNQHCVLVAIPENQEETEE